VATPVLIDDFSQAEQASNGQPWHFSSDRVMGGVSSGAATHGATHPSPAGHVAFFRGEGRAVAEPAVS